MKKLYGLLAAGFMCVGFSGVQAYTVGENILLGVGTGAAARATSYALKEQGDLTNTQSMVGASFVAGVCILAAQTQPTGNANGGFVQLAAALGTYVTSMYVFRTT